MEDIVAVIQARRASDIYVFHDPENPLKPLTAKSVKRQIAKALAQMDIHVELYEVQSLLDATIARVRVNADQYNTKVGPAVSHTSAYYHITAESIAPEDILLVFLMLLMPCSAL